MKSTVVVLLVLIASVAFGGQKTIPNSNGKATSSVTNSYANSQVDTVYWTREAGFSAASFGISVLDSVSITNIILRRIVNGVWIPVAAGDTLVSSLSSTTNTGITRAYAVTLAPIAERYAFVVTYAGSDNGTSSATVKYIGNAQYSK